MSLLVRLFDLHDRVFEALDRAVSPEFLGLATRLMFSAGLLGFFLGSAYLKVIDPTVGPTSLGDWFTLRDAVFIQMAPTAYAEAGYDASALGWPYWAMAYAGTFAEFLLPVLILIGLFTRLAALGMIGFIAVMTLVDVTAHGVDARNIVIVSRLVWVGALFFLVVRGGGWLSVDSLLGRTSVWTTGHGATQRSATV